MFNAEKSNIRLNEHINLQINGTKSNIEQFSVLSPPCGDLGAKLGVLAKSNWSQILKMRPENQTGS